MTPSEIVEWDLTDFGVGKVPGTYFTDERGRPVAEFIVPFEVQTSLPSRLWIDGLRGSGDFGEVFLRFLHRRSASEAGHFRVVRYAAQLAVEASADRFPHSLDEAFEFDAVELTLQGLHEWLASDVGWATERPLGPQSAFMLKWKPDNGATATVDDATFSLNVRNSFDPSTAEWRMRAHAGLQIEFDSPLHLADIEENYIRPIKRALEVAAGRSCSFTRVRLSRRDWPPASAAHERLWADLRSPLIEDVSEALPYGLTDARASTDLEHFSQLIEYGRKWSYALDQLIESMREGISATSSFAHAVIALEGIADAEMARYRPAKWASNLPEIRDALKSVNINSATRRAVERALTEKVPTSLAEKVKELDSQCGSPVGETFGSNAWADDVSLLRNKVLHGDESMTLHIQQARGLRRAAELCQALSVIAWHSYTGSGERPDLLRVINDCHLRWGQVEQLVNEVRVSRGSDTSTGANGMV